MVDILAHVGTLLRTVPHGEHGNADGARHNGGVAQALSEQDRARIKARYPRRSTTDTFVGGAALLVLLALIVFVVIQGLQQSNPPVVADIRSFDVRSAHQTVARLGVQRPDPSVPAECSLFAQAANYEHVAEVTVDVPPSDEQIVTLEVDMSTIKEATSVSVDHCSVVQ